MKKMHSFLMDVHFVKAVLKDVQSLAKTVAKEFFRMMPKAIQTIRYASGVTTTTTLTVMTAVV